MEETCIEIPDKAEDGWQPPILKKVPVQKKKNSTQRCTDVFFMQYAVCVLLLTGMLLLKLYHAPGYEKMLSAVEVVTNAPTEPGIAALLEELSP